MNASHRGIRATTTATVLAALLMALLVSPARALYTPGGGPGSRGDILTDVIINGGTNVSSVAGALGPVGTPPGPYPTTGTAAETVSPQLINIVDTATGTSGQAYCIDFSTDTTDGVGYRNGIWDAANVPNIAYINYILTNYYPFNTSNPISALTATQQVAAVQTAIWYFSDGFVLATGTSAIVRNATTTVVADALANGGTPEPGAPTLTVTPTSMEAPATGELVGPFTVGGNVTGHLDLTPGTEVFYDAAGTQPVMLADDITPGTQLWVRHVDSALPVLGFRITAVATVPHGTVYLFDPRSDPTRTAAQKLILAQNAALPLRAGAYITPYAAGGIRLTKTISGPGAGRQGPVTLRADCDPAPAAGIATTVTLPTGAAAGDHVLSLSGLRAGSTCTVTETGDGGNDAVRATSVAIDGGTVTIVADQDMAVHATDTYALTSTLGTPVLRSAVSRHRVTPGTAFRDRIHVSGLAGAQGATAVARLYGPFPSRAAATCDAAFQARSATVHVQDGWSRTPAVRVNAPGVYTWQVTLLANPSNDAATHPCGQASETVVVARTGYSAPLIDGGYSGTLDPSRQRSAPMTVSLPGVGLHAAVLREAIARGRMTLPGDVSSVGWLRRSARFTDTIGTTVIAGHVSDRHDRPGAMYRLSHVHPGQRITLTRAGITSRFKIIAKASYRRTAKLPQRYFSTTGPHRIVLVSCTDRVLTSGNHFHYTRYQVVVAKLLRG